MKEARVFDRDLRLVAKDSASAMSLSVKLSVFAAVSRKTPTHSPPRSSGMYSAEEKPKRVETVRSCSLTPAALKSLT